MKEENKDCEGEREQAFKSERPPATAHQLCDLGPVTWTLCACFLTHKAAAVAAPSQQGMEPGAWQWKVGVRTGRCPHALGSHCPRGMWSLSGETRTGAQGVHGQPGNRQPWSATSRNIPKPLGTKSLPAPGLTSLEF